MEDSVNFSIDDYEESGWTLYLQDFVSNNHETTDCSYSSLIISDAASLVMNKSSDCNHRINHRNYNLNPNHNHKRLNLVKKRKTISGADDALEDTATSPLNSPKVYDDMMNQFSNNTKKKNHTFNISEEKGKMGSSGRDEDNESIIIGRESELRKRGLCLVPLSMLVNYFP